MLAPNRPYDLAHRSHPLASRQATRVNLPGGQITPAAISVSTIAPPPAMRRKRASKPKVRTGCKTCKVCSPASYFELPFRIATPLGSRQPLPRKMTRDTRCGGMRKTIEVSQLTLHSTRYGELNVMRQNLLANAARLQAGPVTDTNSPESRPASRIPRPCPRHINRP